VPRSMRTGDTAQHHPATEARQNACILGRAPRRQRRRPPAAPRRCARRGTPAPPRSMRRALSTATAARGPATSRAVWSTGSSPRSIAMRRRPAAVARSERRALAPPATSQPRTRSRRSCKSTLTARSSPGCGRRCALGPERRSRLAELSRRSGHIGPPRHGTLSSWRASSISTRPKCTYSGALNAVALPAHSADACGRTAYACWGRTLAGATDTSG